MKKYLKPYTEIETTLLSVNFLAGSDPNSYNEEGDGEAINRGFFDDLEDSYPPKDNGLWDDAYKKEK